jgi:chromate transporter
MDWLTYFWLLLKASLFTTGGSGNLPILFDELIPRGWAEERQFAEALAIGQLSPGPSGLWVISLGYLAGGIRGALLALLAIILPPLLVIPLMGLYRRAGAHPAMEGFVRGLSLAVVAIVLVVMLQLLQTSGLSPRSLLIASLSLGLGLLRRVPVVAILGVAALLGVLF